MPFRSTHLIFHNKTPFTLTRTDGGLDHGVFTEPFHFIDSIAPNQTVDWETESDGINTGTEGFVNYRVGSGPDGFHIHWDNPAEGTNKYNEFVKEGFELFHTGGVGNNTIVDYTLALSVPHGVPGFLPSRSGFHFSNSFPDTPDKHLDIVFLNSRASIPIGNASNGLCGGMVYAVRDYYEAEQLPPPDTSPPPREGDPLFDYIVDRLFKSFDLPGGPVTYFTLMEPAHPDTDENILNPFGLAAGKAFVMAKEEWPKIKADIDSGHPSPIGLILVRSANPLDLGKNHQVLVYGYALSGGNLTLRIYDPNKPNNDNVTLSLNIDFTDRRIDVVSNPSEGLSPVLCFFRTEYSSRNPVRGISQGHSLRRFLFRQGIDPASGVRALQPGGGSFGLRSKMGI